MNTSAAVFPLGQAFLPGEWVPLRVFEPRYVQMVRDLQDGTTSLCTVLIERGSEVGGDDARLEHGVRLLVEDIAAHGAGFHLVCRADHLVTVLEWGVDDPYPRGLITDQVVEAVDAEKIDNAVALMLGLVSNCGELLASLHLPSDARTHWNEVLSGVQDSLANFGGTSRHDEILWRSLWLVGRMIPCGALDRYSLLTPGTLIERVTRCNDIVDLVRDVMRFGMQE